MNHFQTKQLLLAQFPDSFVTLLDNFEEIPRAEDLLDGSHIFVIHQPYSTAFIMRDLDITVYIYHHGGEVMVEGSSDGFTEFMLKCIWIEATYVPTGTLSDRIY